MLVLSLEATVLDGFERSFSMLCSRIPSDLARVSLREFFQIFDLLTQPQVLLKSICEIARSRWTIPFD
jgi:hypothetical protein